MLSPYDPPKDKADYMAHWLAKYGISMVRLGHLVTEPGSGSVVDWKQPDSAHLNPEVMDRLDFYIARLAEHGIYTRPTMLWYRKMREADGVYIPDEVKEQAKKANKEALLDSVGITFFDPKVMQANIELEVAIMTHRNPYRNNMMYGEDPAVCQIEVTNEDSLFFYTMDSIPDYYKKELDKLWGDWLLKRYGSREKLAAAWGADLAQGESPAGGHRQAPDHLGDQQHLRRRSSPRAGPAALLLRAGQRLLQQDEGRPARAGRAAAHLRHGLAGRRRRLLDRDLLQRAGHGLHGPPPLLGRRPLLAGPAGAALRRHGRAEEAGGHPEAGRRARHRHAVRRLRVGQRAARPVGAGGRAADGLLRQLPERVADAHALRREPGRL